MKEILRKCYVCDKVRTKTINLDTNKYIYYNNSFYHYDCFIKFKISKKDNQLSQEEVVKMANDLVLKTSENKTVRESVDRDRLTYWLYDNYNVTVLPPLIFTKLKQINDGTFSKRINAPISYYDLLQIFIKMKSHLEKIRNKNERMGKKIDTIRLVDYDLAIVINNYDDYLKWRQKQATELVEKNQVKNEMKLKQNIDINTISSLQRKNNNQNEINIADILDEVF